MSWAATGVGIGVAGIGSSILGGMSANKKAKKAAKEQAKLTYSQRKEEIRQRGRAARSQKGLARATLYASNLQESGSGKRYIADLDMENMREIANARYAAEKEKQAIKAGAQGLGNSLFYQAAGDAIGLGVQAFANRAPAANIPMPSGLNPQGVVNTPAAQQRAPASIG